MTTTLKGGAWFQRVKQFNENRLQNVPFKRLRARYYNEVARQAGGSVDGSATWVSEIMEETGELFEKLAGRVGALLRELTLK